MKCQIRYFFSFFLLLICCNSFSQTSYTDSLLNVLKTEKDDTIRVNVLNNLFVDYEYIDGKKAKRYLDEAFELAKKINYKRCLGTAYMYYGYYDEDNDNYPDALKNHVTSLLIRLEINDKKTFLLLTVI